MKVASYRYKFLVCGTLILTMGIISSFGVSLMYGHSDEMPAMSSATAPASGISHVIPCIMMGEMNICGMTPLEHIRQFKSLFAGVIPRTILLAMSILFMMLAILKLRIPKRFLGETTQPPITYLKLPPAFRFATVAIKPSPVLEFFARIHPRLYA